MVLVKFRLNNGEEQEVEGEAGLSLMEVATRNGVDGILADCGGACSCATCHVYVSEAWIDRLPAKSATEADMLECVEEPRDTSRLSCQVTLTADLDGLEVEVPAE